MKRLFIYWRAYLRGYLDKSQWNKVTVFDVATPEGRAEWWGYADGVAFRVRSSTPPFCRACGQPMCDSDRPYKWDPNLGVVCQKCRSDRELQIGTAALGDCPRDVV